MNLKLSEGSFAAGEFINEHFLFCFYFREAFEFDCVPFQFCFFFVEVVIEFHHFSLSVFGLAFPFISFSECS